MIGIFDSGMGGLSVLREIVRILPEEDYVYYADSAHCPYGDKDREYVTERAFRITEFLLEKGCGIIVVACNTATSAAISSLREHWRDIPFVGMEPALKPAATGTRSGVVGVLATAGTLGGSKYLDLRHQYEGSDVRIVEHVGKGFVELVEKEFEAKGISMDISVDESDEAESLVRESVTPLLQAGADTIVLGCTHYPFLEGLIAKVAGSGIRIINPAPAVAAQVSRIYTQDRGEGEGTIQYYRSTAEGEDLVKIHFAG